MNVEVFREGDPDLAERMATWIERDREAHQFWKESRDRLRASLPPIVHRYSVGDRVRCVGPNMRSAASLGFGDTGTVSIAGGDPLYGGAVYRVEMDLVPGNYVSDLTFFEDELSPLSSTQTHKGETEMTAIENLAREGYNVAVDYDGMREMYQVVVTKRGYRLMESERGKSADEAAARIHERLKGV